MKLKPGGGYTIIEVMIFLVVSTALLVAVMTTLSGKQERTRFTESVEILDRDYRDALNDVSTGFYPTAGDFTCTSDSSGLQFPVGTTEQGANTGCIFLGKAIGPGASPSQYNVYTMVAARGAKNLTEAHTQLLGVGTNPGLVDKRSSLADIQVVKMISRTSGRTDVQGIAIVSEFNQTSGVGNKITGNASRVTLNEVYGNFTANAGKPAPSMLPADKGTLICLRQGSNGRIAAILLGTTGSQLSTEIKFDSETPGECTS
jgi:type II secretory pathway pseudopilin PulG